MSDDIKVEGLAELQALLDELPAKIEANVVRGGLRQAAKVVEEEAKRLCPVGKTGALQDSIRVSMRAKHGHISATVKAGGGKVFYAAMVSTASLALPSMAGRIKGCFFAPGWSTASRRSPATNRLLRFLGLIQWRAVPYSTMAA